MQGVRGAWISRGFALYWPHSFVTNETRQGLSMISSTRCRLGDVLVLASLGVLLAVEGVGGGREVRRLNGVEVGERDSLLVRFVRPGVLHRSIVDSRGPWLINILEIDLRRSDLWIESARAWDTLRGRERTSGMAARCATEEAAAVAALNADFFNMETGESVNNQVRGGEILRAVVPVGAPGTEETVVRSQIGFRNDNSPVLGPLVFDGSILWPRGGRSPLASVNVLRSRTPYVLFTSAFGSATPRDLTARGEVDLPLRRVERRGDTIISVVEGKGHRAGGTPLSADRIVLTTVNVPSALDTVRPDAGDTVALVLSFRPPAPNLRSLVGGIPWLVRGGKVVQIAKEELEGASMDFATRRHPRTGIGFSRDSATAYFLTVDGRQAASVGMSLQEFGDLMVGAGVFEGLNLDGGGSTTMVVDGVVVNSPSDAAGERPVANCLLVMERRPKRD